jgi:hypothetical protein
MTGYKSKRAAARDKLEDDDTQVYQTELTKLLMESYDRGVADALEETKAALAQRTWVDLTDEEITKTYWSREPFKRPTPLEFARDLLTKFKEKNNGTTP